MIKPGTLVEIATDFNRWDAGTRRGVPVPKGSIGLVRTSVKQDIGRLYLIRLQDGGTLECHDCWLKVLGAVK